MSTPTIFSDVEHPAVQAKADELTRDKTSHLEAVESLFNFVQNGIRFGFPPTWDEVKASETLLYKVGYCNTKATLFAALCKAAGIPARIHTGLINLDIMHGVMPAFVFPFMPPAGGHSWTEIQIDGTWKPVDSYINDRRYYEEALKRLKRSGKKTGFSISEAQGPSSCDFNFGEKGFMHMGAVVEDHGVWQDFAEYMSSEKYVRMNRMQMSLLPLLIRMTNRNIQKTRGW
jgi:transglutaminase-like putative cysteine protease